MKFFALFLTFGTYELVVYSWNSVYKVGGNSMHENSCNTLGFVDFFSFFYVYKY